MYQPLKYIKQHNFFNFDNYKKCFLITKSEWVQKDHITLKTGIMADEIQLCGPTWINKTIKHILNCNNILLYFLYHSFDQINAALVSIRNFQNH